MGLTLEYVVERSPRPGARVGCVCKIRGSPYGMCTVYCEGPGSAGLTLSLPVQVPHAWMYFMYSYQFITAPNAISHRRCYTTDIQLPPKSGQILRSHVVQEEECSESPPV
jgi:hypothetical protein